MGLYYPLVNASFCDDSLLISLRTSSGHNLNLAHAGEGTLEYGDQSGMMGYSSSEDSTKMCFNPARSWQLGWYSDKRIELDMKARGQFSGELIGLTDYGSNTAGKYVNIKIENGSTDFFIGFNLAKGINYSTREGRNDVTIQSQQEIGYNYSVLLAKLAKNDKYSISKFKGNVDLIIEVNDLVFTNPPFAKIDIYLDGCRPGSPCGPACGTCPTNSPISSSTSSPTSLPTASPTASPVTPNLNWIVLFQEGFEKGFDLFTNDGKNTRIDKKYFNEGSASLRLSDNSGISMATTSNAYDVSCMNQLKVHFFYYCRGVKKDESFFLEYSADGGSSWQAAEIFVRGIDWNKNNKWSEASVEWDVSSASISTIQLRFRAEFSDRRDKVYIDDVLFEGAMDGFVAGYGGDFGDSESTTFGSCSHSDWIVLFEEGFEDGYVEDGGVFDDGGKDTKIQTRRKYEGEQSLRLRDGSATSMVTTLNAYDVSSMTKIRVNFFYNAQGIEDGDFFVLYYCTDGEYWQEAKRFVRGEDWQNNNNRWREGSVEWDVASASPIQLRFRSYFGSNAEMVYIDNVLFEGQR
jgi:hypothetical protein